jgi:hypothetical protein
MAPQVDCASPARDDFVAERELVSTVFKLSSNLFVAKRKGRSANCQLHLTRTSRSLSRLKHCQNQLLGLNFASARTSPYELDLLAKVKDYEKTF